MTIRKTHLSPRQCIQLRLQAVANVLQKLVDDQLSGDKATATRKNVARKLKIADADSDDDPSTTKLLHDLRVSCRRAEIALKICPQELSKKQAGWFRDELRDVRHSCNMLRDDEILRKWLRDLPKLDVQQQLLKSVSKNIKQGHHDAAKRAQSELQRRHFTRRVDELWTDDADEDLPASSSELWRASLGRALMENMNDLVQAIPDAPADYAGLHQLRIATKHLRYSAEFAEELDPRLRLPALIKLLTNMQDKLGELHDAVVRLDRLSTDFDKVQNIAALSELAKAELATTYKKWTAWWQKNTLRTIITQTGNAASMLFNHASD